MDKDNQFKSCSFYLATDDVVHIRVKDLVGVMPYIDLVGDGDAVEDGYYEDLPVVHYSDVLLVTSSNPAEVYAYNPLTKVSTLLTIPGVVTTSADIAHTETKLWVYGAWGTIMEYDITLSPFSATYNRTITGFKNSPGLCAIDNNTLISFDIANAYVSDISGAIASDVLRFSMATGRGVAGDYVLNSDNKLIVLNWVYDSGGALKRYITQYNYNTGAVEVDIDISSLIYPYGLFQYGEDLYITEYAGRGEIYKINRTYPFEYSLVDTLSYSINGASQVPSYITSGFTTTLSAIPTQHMTSGAGQLYNYYAVSDAKNIANTGYHVATTAEWTALSAFLGATGGGKMKKTGYVEWCYPNTGATNEVGMNVVGAGFRDSTGYFSGVRKYARFWHGDDSHYAGITENSDVLSPDTHLAVLTIGFSVLIAADATALPEGGTGTYTGNDGTVYGTVVVNGVEFISEPLNETKYRDGSDIPEVTDRATWVGLATGARCYVDNDIRNA